MTTETVPACPSCGSRDMIVGGHVSYHWRRGRLVRQRSSATPVEGAPWNCQDCGMVWSGNHEPPFDFEAQSSVLIR
ncbi:putative RNA-binding Zn-ribbon protein involved in translation (DUF1610 family) [Azospirillum melinis]|nr:putative RNA-binding Zn-ribbon protein involved in translation (DUF1610 family) [Azospirillum melinis]